jgi:cobalt-precorrin-6B (C15)-methyltransferase
MTKEEVRAITLSKLRMEDGLICVDIGAGTGSITVEMGLQSPHGKVVAIETNEEAIALIHKNVARFHLENVEILHGTAPEDLPLIEGVDRVMVGGSKGNLPQIVSWIQEHMKPEGIVVGNFIVLENVTRFIRLLKDHGFTCEVIQLSLSRGRFVGDLTMMEGTNPITIVTGRKIGGEENI